MGEILIDNELAVIKQSIEELEAIAKEFVISNKEHFDDAQTMLEIVLIKKKEVNAYWKPQEQKAFDAKKKASESLRGLRDMIDESIAPLDKADQWLRQKRQAYKNEQDRKDREEQKRLQDIADKKAAKEQEELLKKAEKAAETDDVVTEEKLIEEADEIIAEPVFTPKTIEKSERTKTGTLNTWVEEIEIEILDVKKICSLIGNGELPVNCATISAAKIKAHAKAFDKKDGKYEGYSIKRVQNERVRLDGRN